jgi:hypothetical protein
MGYTYNDVSIDGRIGPFHNPEPDDEVPEDAEQYEPDPDDERERIEEMRARIWERFA